MEFFKSKYRDIDVLIIDDIQFLGGATASQQEFFHTFNNLHNDSKQIIVSSDRSPDDLNKLEERLRTRFNWGLTIDILPPDFKLRMDIIDKKIEANNTMRLDFFKQYFILVSNVYIGNLSWGEVIYKEDKIYLLDCKLTHASELHKVPKLSDRDYLIIDCKNHDREIHSFYPTYKTYVSNEDTQLYTFSG